MDFWLYFSARPLFWLILTISVFLFACWINSRAQGSPLAHPVLVSLAILICFLKVADVEYEAYFEGAQFIHFLLGPATVALAVPLYDQKERIKSLVFPILVACCVGALTASVSAIAMAMLMGGSTETILSMAPKSVTSPIAMGIAEKIGGIPSLTAGLVLITGAIGCLIAGSLFRVMKIQRDDVRGFTLGLTAHGLGTAHAFEISAVAGAFAGLGMGLTGLATTFILPLVANILGFH